MAGSFRTPYVHGLSMQVPAIPKKPRPLRLASMRGGLAGLAQREDPHRAYPAAKPISIGSLMKATRPRKASRASRPSRASKPSIA